MKKWVRYIQNAFLLLVVILPVMAAQAASGELAVKNNEVAVTLNIPEGATETITSLRFRMYVSVSAGSMDEPVFRFADSMLSEVKDAAVTKKDGGYLIDIILSGKENQNIFNGSEQAGIGTLTLRPESGEFKASVEILGEMEDGGQPVVYYMDSGGYSVLTIPLANMSPVTVTGSTSQTPGGPGSVVVPSNPSVTQTPGASATPKPESSPEASPAPGATASPDATAMPEISPSPDNSASPAPSAGFAKTKKPKFAAKAKNCTKEVKFSWSKIAGADGYLLYRYDSATGKYKRIKTVSGQSATSYVKKFAFGKTFSFKLRAFWTGEDGVRIYGRYSDAVRVKTAPSRVSGLKAGAKGKNKTALSWKKTAGADGYQIYCSNKKNGKYTLVKTVKKGSVHRYTIGQKGGKKRYYKVRAYVTGADKKKVYGSFSAKAGKK